MPTSDTLDRSASADVSTRMSRDASWGLWLAVALVVISLVQLLSRPDGWVGTATYLAVTVGAGFLALWLARRLPLQVRTPWLWLAAGMACSGVADLLWELVSWRNGGNADLSVADAFYLASYVLLGIGLYRLLPHTGRVDVDMLLDLASFVLLSLILVYQLLDVDAILDDAGLSTAERLVSVAYPMLDAVLVAMLGKAVLTGGLRSVSGVVLALGLNCWLAADFVAMLVGDASVESAWTNLGWMWGSTAVAIAITQVGPVRPVRNEPRDTLNLLLGLVPLLVPGAIAIWAYFNGIDTNPLPMFVASVLLIGLAFARSMRLLRARDSQAAQLAHNERYYHALAMNSAEAVLVVGPDGRLLNDEPNLMRLMGLDEPVRAGADAITLLRSPDNRELAQSMLERMRATNGVVSELTIHGTHTDGSERWFGLRALNLIDDPDVGGLVVNVHDVTDQKRAEHELAHLAFHDTLTGLPNRALFNDRLEHAMERNERTGLDVAIVYLDLDGFKTVNDSLGHDTGDDVLRQAATRLATAIRPADTVARLGGDEFAILIEAADRPLEQATAVADRVLRAMAAPMRVGDDEMVLSASIGIAISDSSSTGLSMLRDADIAMYQAKTSGKGTWAVYDAAMRSAVVERLEMETELVRALADGQFELLYQPIVRLATGDVTGFEALLRWHHPTRGVILPELFVPLAEETGAIVDIGEWVLREACHTAAAWHRAHPGLATTMAVNVSAREMVAPHIVEHVRAALAASGLPPELLVLELTESSLVRDPGLVTRRLDALHELGVKIAIDDFGTGYSSLNYLRQFKVDILKIDQSFVRTITDTERTPAVLRGLLDLARTLDLETIAEGIEVGAQHDSLCDQRCEFGQGFLYARPMSITDAAEVLDRSAGVATYD